MLGKLIKYDMKALNRFLILLHAFLILSAVLVRIFLTGRLLVQTPQEGTLFGLAFLLYILIVTAASFGTSIVIAVRFYKNLYSDEGYLTHTLPVTAGQHLLSKTIAATLWSVIDLLLILASIFIVIATPFMVESYHTHKAEILRELGFTGQYADISFAGIVLLLMIFTLVSAFSSVISIYASIALGQLFSGHRVLGAVVAYFALSTIVSVLSFGILSVLGLFFSNSTFMDFNFVEYTRYLMNVSNILALGVGIILYIMTYYIMKKKIDLA